MGSPSVREVCVNLLRLRSIGMVPASRPVVSKSTVKISVPAPVPEAATSMPPEKTIFDPSGDQRGVSAREYSPVTGKASAS